MRYSPLLLALLVAPLAACNDDTTAPPGTDVTTSGQSFTPANLTLAANDSIATWFISGGPHNVTWEDAAPGSGDISDGSYTREFVGANNTTYRYRCTLHSTNFTTGMVGTVTVP